MTSSSSSSKTLSFRRGRKEWHLVERFMVLGVRERERESEGGGVGGVGVWDFGFQIFVEWVTKRKRWRGGGQRWQGECGWSPAAAMRPCTTALWDKEIENEKARESLTKEKMRRKKKGLKKKSQNDRFGSLNGSRLLRSNGVPNWQQLIVKGLKWQNWKLED